MVTSYLNSPETWVFVGSRQKSLQRKTHLIIHSLMHSHPWSAYSVPGSLLSAGNWRSHPNVLALGSSQLRRERGLREGQSYPRSELSPGNACVCMCMGVCACMYACVCVCVRVCGFPLGQAHHPSLDTGLMSLALRVHLFPLPGILLDFREERDQCFYTLNYANHAHFINLWKYQIALTITLNFCPLINGFTG